MKLATYTVNGGKARIGLVVGEGLLDVARHLPQAPETMLGLLEALPGLRADLDKIASAKADHKLSDVRLLAPIPRPSKILALGLNYRDHALEANMALPEVQTWFAKMTTSANDPYAHIDLPSVSTKLDYEAELAIVIGRKVRHATREQAKAAIAGYCCANDVSVRDWQLRVSQFVVGKSFDSHCPFGPWITSADEIADPQALSIRATVNGEVRQDSNTREMVFDVYAMIEHLSQAMTLEPGDLLLTGTPAGVGAVSKPPRYLKAGDVVRIEIEGLGAIENRVEPESR